MNDKKITEVYEAVKADYKEKGYVKHPSWWDAKAILNKYEELRRKK